MSPRPFRIRRISNPPPVSGFKPYGNKKSETPIEDVFLHIEEYEAIRLCDHEMLNHSQAAVFMAVSRPTLTRIYARARQKIAKALVMGRQIIIEGGKIYFDSEWYRCNVCDCFFNNPFKDEDIKKCPLCKSSSFSVYNQNFQEVEETVVRLSDYCICPECGTEKTHIPGNPCKNEICPECGKYMVKKGSRHDKNILTT